MPDKPDQVDIYVKCPTTGKLANTHMSAGRETFHSNEWKGNKFECEHCGATHMWSTDDAVLIDKPSSGTGKQGH